MARQIKIKDGISRKVSQMAKDFPDLPDEAFKYFRSITPRQSGFARRNTIQKGESIVANYNYAVPLNEGSSKQAPQGMVDPTLDFIQDRIKKIVRK